ncbi:hypothetical protein DCCM_4557 [Desulfocucumis palustris]|uniref:Uncharacterized protein n=1 Tax=Desulfocucumis palustris TaxID=1898651 RepID=A0A2L2XH12_9FIRM|nr:hypothetical protein [Desulfocucumis palustris]GBF35430.1 hypothetical protein DCCM_4557 [Desulfocucumis palustris]
MKFYSDDYYTVVAKNRKEAVKFFITEKLTDEEGLDEIQEINPEKKKMLFPVDELPEQYHDEEMYPRKNLFGEYLGVEITLQEAVQYHKEKPPYIISMSSELM